MREIKNYQCEICGMVDQDRSKILECEERHAETVKMVYSSHEELISNEMFYIDIESAVLNGGCFIFPINCVVVQYSLVPKKVGVSCSCSLRVVRFRENNEDAQTIDVKDVRRFDAGDRIVGVSKFNCSLNMWFAKLK